MIVVTGANGVVGYPLCLELASQAPGVMTVSRSVAKVQNKQYGANSAKAVQWDLEHAMSNQVKDALVGCDTMIHCAPIWLLPAHLHDLKALGLERLIVFSSTSVLSKSESPNPHEQNLVEQLGGAEQALQEFCAEQSIALTILRPSLIYGYGRDQNIMHIANFIRKFGFMLLVGKANGERQPVHASDLVEACCNIIDNSKTFGKAYNLAGAEVLSYHIMVERVFTALHKKPRIIRLPLGLFRFALRLAARLTSFAYTPEMADRMNQNLSYSNLAAEQDFNYQPSPFLQNPQRDLTFGFEADQTS